MIRRTPSRLTVLSTALVLSLLSACSREGAPPVRPLVAAAELAQKPAAKKVARKELAAHRKLQIERLHAYAEARAFPRNPLPSPTPIHMFRDADGHLCPIANLIHEDGHVALVDRMAKEHNDVVVADETSGPLHEWVLTSGLTNEEVRRIQGIGFPGEGGGFGGAMKLSPHVVAELDLLAHLQAVEQELLDATDASLDLALDRLDARAAQL